MCDRIARKDGVTLKHRFWDEKKWRQVFLGQLDLANRLLKQYSAEAIIRALRTPQGKKIYSFGAPFLPRLAETEQERLDKRSQEVPEAVKPAQEKPRPNFVEKPTTLSKLRDLD